MSAKRSYTGRSSNGARTYTPYRGGVRKGFYGRRYNTGFNRNYRELKYQTLVYNTNIDRNGFYQLANPTGICANGIQVGADVKQRVGRKIAMKSLQLFVKVNCAFQETPNPNYSWFPRQLDPTSPSVRILVYYDRNNNGNTAPAAQPDLLDPAMVTSNIEGFNHWVHAAKNLANTDRFLFLLDKTYVFERGFNRDPGEPIHTTLRPIEKRFFIPLKNLTVTYNGVGDTLGNINEGSLIIYMITDRTSQSLYGGCYTEIAARLRYSDL